MFVGIVVLFFSIWGGFYFHGVVAVPSNYENNCAKTLAAGQNFMTGAAVLSSTRTVVVKRNGVALTSGDSYIPGESLVLSLSDVSGVQYAFSVAAGTATITGGFCSQKRIASSTNPTPTVIMPSSGEVVFRAGFAGGYTTMSVTHDFVLNAPVATTAPSIVPTIVPSQLPSLLPTAVPTTVAPSKSPTMVPSLTPTQLPSLLPSQVPTVTPSTLPTVTPSITPTQTPSVVPSQLPSLTFNPTTFSPPTQTPTIVPTQPTEQPSLTPTQPTMTPTQVPSVVPSFSPSATPSTTPSVTPSVIPSTAPSVSPTVTPSNKPSIVPVSLTLSPSKTPSNNPSRSPSQLPTTVPTAPTVRPTRKPTTQSPTRTFAPSLGSRTSCGYRLEQYVNNIPASTFAANNDIQNAFTSAMYSSLSTFSRPSEVRIASFNDVIMEQIGSNAVHRRSNKQIDNEHSRQLATVTYLNVTYSITYVLEATKFASAEALQGSLILAAKVISNSNIFIKYLDSAGIPALNAITTTSISTVSSPVTTLVQSAAPSSSPVSVSLGTSETLDGQITTGVVVGVVSLFVFAAMTRWYVSDYERIQVSYAWVASVPPYLAVSCALAALVLVSCWAQKWNNILDNNFLGIPNWKSNLFAWHPVLMVGGFYVAQVCAICDWSLFPSDWRPFSKGVHVLLQSGALACMIAVITLFLAGMMAIVKYKLDQKSPSLNSMHSWIGVAAVVMFCTNYAIGLFMGILTAISPNSVLHKAIAFLRIHRAIGLISLGLSSIAITSGIMDRLAHGACFYDLDAGEIYSADLNPAEHYNDDLKSSCKIVHGMGICVILAAFFTVLAVSLRVPSQPHVHRDGRDTLQHVSPMETDETPTKDARHDNVVASRTDHEIGI